MQGLLRAYANTFDDLPSALSEARDAMETGDLDAAAQALEKALADTPADPLAKSWLAQVNLNRIGTRDIGFGIGPRLNAAGRVDDARLALDLLLTKDIVAATMADVRSGRLEPKIGTAMAYMGTALLKAIETAELEDRIEALERLNKLI